MAGIEKDDVVLGYEPIDSHHVQLVELINEIEICLDKSDKSSITDAMEDFLEYVMFHFNEEEKLMEAYFYPDASIHYHEHAAFIDKINLFIQNCKEGQWQKLIEEFKFLKPSFFYHIVRDDKKLVEFLQHKKTSES